MFETLKEYELLYVGLEENYKKKIKKIEQYQFDEWDIEESYLLALLFKRNFITAKKKHFF